MPVPLRKYGAKKCSNNNNYFYYYYYYYYYYNAPASPLCSRRHTKVPEPSAPTASLAPSADPRLPIFPYNSSLGKFVPSARHVQRIHF